MPHDPTTTSLLIANHNWHRPSRATRQPPRPVVCHSRALLLDANRPVFSESSVRFASILSRIHSRHFRRRIGSGPYQGTPAGSSTISVSSSRYALDTTTTRISHSSHASSSWPNASFASLEPVPTPQFATLHPSELVPKPGITSTR
jgi:hypothetical protein